ncbi:MAG TPA: beta-propeller domain-containing protein, partial [Labilithrix sp.]
MKLVRSSLFAFFALAATACGSSGSDSSSTTAPSGNGSQPTPPATATDAQRAIAEADIIQLEGNLLFAMSKSGTVSVVDVSEPARLVLAGQTTIPGQPFEMYFRDGVLLAMSNAAIHSDGSAYASTDDSASDPGAGAMVTTLDVHDPSKPQTLSTYVIPGEIADSRIVGDVLYLVTYENAQCYRCGTAPRTMLTSFDAKQPTNIQPIDQASFASTAPDAYNLPWGSAWKRSIFATDTRLYIGGHADIDPSTYDTGSEPEGIIDVVDISDPGGKLAAGARLHVGGAVLSRWQMDERNGIFRVVSERGAGRTGNGVAMPDVDTFTIESTTSYVPLGHTTLALPRQEGLRTVRFDDQVAYAITYNQTDPLFTIDLSQPASPTVRGALSMPGFMFYLEPHGDRLIGLGVDRTDPNGSLNVSLFDVSNLDSPKMLQRVAFGAKDLGEDYAILNYELPEDQDRIQKAFRVFDDGLVVVPFTSSSSYYDSDGCSTNASGVQMVEWQSDTLVKRALLPVSGNPRRAFEHMGEMVTVSDSNVRSFSLARRDAALQTADLVIGSCVAKTLPQGLGAVGEGDYAPAYGGYAYACAASPARAGAPAWPGAL